MERVFVINPRARGGRVLKAWATLRSSLLATGREHFGAPEELVSQSIDEWVVVGGDGSVQRCVEVLMRAASSGEIERLPQLSVLPLGTGGDYSRSLSRSDRFTPADLGRVTFSGEAPRYFANVASVGFSAQVAEAKEQWPGWTPRALAYLGPTLLKLPVASPVPLKLRWSEGQSWEGRVWALFVCKGRFAGGGMQFARSVDLADGQFEVVWVEDISVFSVLRKIPGLYSGGLLEQGGVRRLRSDRIEVQGDTQTLAVDLDGEPFHSAQMEFSVVPASSSGIQIRLFPRVENRLRV